MKQTTKRKQPWSSCVRYPVAEAGLSSGEALLLFLLQLARSAPTGIVSSTIQGVQFDNLLSRKKMWTRRKVQEVKINFFLPKMDLVFGTLLGVAPVTGRSHVAEVPPTRDYVFWD